MPSDTRYYLVCFRLDIHAAWEIAFQSHHRENARRHFARLRGQNVPIECRRLLVAPNASYANVQEAMTRLPKMGERR